ncbi:hypothetical protein R1flu_005234 [Riccia fluitans]|uniref:DNA-directed RNA polymerase n=1 Tax=Riccia fluitans TaxID=41844 RepID=A0ABD1YSK1_9MARC
MVAFSHVGGLSYGCQKGSNAGGAQVPTRISTGKWKFGLLSTSAILKLSVFDMQHSLRKPKDLTSERLGLPTPSGHCTTCNASAVDQVFFSSKVKRDKVCQGHFGHVLLPTPIFHPNHVLRLVRLLRKICLNCGKPKESLRRKRGKNPIERDKKKNRAVAPDVSDSQNPVDTSTMSNKKRRFSTLSNEGTEASEVIVLSSDEEELTSTGNKVPETFPNEEDISGGKASSSTPRMSCDRKGKRKHPGDYMEANPTIIPTALDLTDVLVCVKKAKKNTAVRSSSGVEVVDNTFCSSIKDNFTAEEICLYCSRHSHSSRYPEVQVKLEVNGDATNLAKSIVLEIRKEDYKNVDVDYWSFVGGSSSSSGKVPRTRKLLPSEALKVLRKIPEKAFLKLGMHPDYAPPEALVVECLPVPPNCTRLQEDAFGAGGTNVGFKLGAAPGKEKKRTDHIGRVQKKNSRWSLDWLKRNILGKRSGFSARNVVTGDPFLTIEEIGIPLEVAKYLTYPVRVTRLNQSKLQEFVEVGQALGATTRACGAARIEKDGMTLVVTPRSNHSLEIGDVVHRHLRDGDLVYVNRPPSLHKHSLIALKTHIQDSATFTINPAVCTPLHADFDGDCLHVFVPQSEESKAELRQLLSVPEQILPPLADKTVLGLSQDNILGAHLVTSSPLFVEKELMQQLAMWSSWRLPVPTIVKAPKSGPWWTGKQIIDLIIPDEFSYRNSEGTLVIEDGELLSDGGERNWLTSTGGLVSALARCDRAMAVKHLDCSQAVLREWLMAHGFSVSLTDLYAAPDEDSRRRMKAQILNGLRQAQEMAIATQHIFDRKRLRYEVRHNEEASDDTRDQIDDVIENVAVSQFLDNFSQIGEEITEAIDCKNSLLAMVRSGSKGSVTKVFQQFGSLGLQLHKGERLLAVNDNKKLCSVGEAFDYQGKWEARGLIKNSLLDGLDPLEFFFHAVAVRAGLLRQSLEVAKPGELFKRLMLCLRDVHVSYDGTVRNKSGLEIIQFRYGAGYPVESNQGEAGEGKESIMPGEAVGILAATAIAQPAYQVMLEATHNVGSRKIRPLELLQETMFPRSTSDLKDADRRSILRLRPCDCDKLFCNERRILEIQSALLPLTVQAFARSTAIEYIPHDSEEWDAFSLNGETQKLWMPWVGHILLDQTAMSERGLHEEKLLDILKRRVDDHTKTLRKFRLGPPLFSIRRQCSCMRLGLSSEYTRNRLCLHFSPMPRSNPKRRVKVSRNSTEDTVEMLQNFLLPFIMHLTVKGDERIESTRILWEDTACSQLGRSRNHTGCSEVAANGELTLEVTVKRVFSRGRGIPWNITKEACIPVEEAIDWRRSSPYSVQEMRCAFGIEAARDCILERFNLATQATGSAMGVQHLELVADLMVHSGEVHGLTSHGYRDLLRSLKTKAPLTAGAFRAPIKSFMEAGERGEEEVLSGVLASCVFGKRVPVGTGADFSLKLNSSESSYNSVLMSNSVDMHEYLKDLTAKIGVEKPDTPPQSEFEWGDTANGIWSKSSPLKTGGWDGAKESHQNPGAWGSPKAADKTNSGAWGDDGWCSPKVSDKTSGGAWEDGGWGASKAVEKPSDGGCEAGGWGASKSPDKTGGGIWGDGGWGSSKSPDKTSGASAGGWGSQKGPNKASGGLWEDDGPGKATGGTWEVGGWSSSTGPDKSSAGASGGDDGCPWVSLDKTASNKGAGLWASPKNSEKTAAGGWDSSPKTSEPVKGKKPAEWGDGGGAWVSSPNRTASDVVNWGAEDAAPTETCGWDTVGNDDAAGAWETDGETKSTSAKAGCSSWETEDAGPSMTSGWDSAGNDHPGAWADGKDSQCSGPGGWSGKQKSLSGEKSDGLKEKGKRQFKPTGANTIPLGKVRVFGNMVQELPVLGSVSPSSALITDNESEKNATQSSGGWQTKKDANGKRPENRRELDPRRESEEWKELENLVRSIRNIFKKYELEARIVGEDENLLLGQILPNHPNSEAKVGCGIDYFKVANHMDTRCFFLVRKDGTREDFSYHKCLLTLASKKNPSLADLYRSQYMSRRTIEVELDETQAETKICGTLELCLSFEDSDVGPQRDSSA